MTDVTRTKFELILQIDIPNPQQTGQGTGSSAGPSPDTTEDPQYNTIVQQAASLTGIPISELSQVSLNDPRIPPDLRPLVASAINALQAGATPNSTVTLPSEGVTAGSQSSGVEGVPPSLQTLTFRCVQFNATFAMNRIPMASAAIAVGREAHSLRTALIHSRPDAFRQMYRARVTLNPIGQWSASDQNPNDTILSGRWTKAGPQRIFDGYVTGTGYRKSRGTLQMTVQLIHWLSDLSFSSIFSNQSHPANPADLTFSTIYTQVTAAGTALGSAFIGAHGYTNDFTSLNIQSDLWSKALAETFCKIGDRDLIQLGSPLVCGGLDQRNDFSLSALSRIEGSFSCRAAGAENRWHIPLTLTGLGGNEGLVAQAISQYVGQQTLRSWWSTTLWDKLVNDLGPAFMFHIVPRVETAVIAPFVAGLRGTGSVNRWAKIKSEDVSRMYLQGYVRRPLRGVGIFAGRDSNTTAMNPDGRNIASFNGVGGCYIPDENARGMIILKRAPGWMATLPNFTTGPSQSVMGRAGPGAPAAATNSATTPPDDITGLLPNQSSGDAAIQTRGFHDRMAQYLYMMEILRGRVGTIAGKFRLDIAPGSTVFIEDIGEQIIEAAAAAGLTVAPVDLASPDIYATVKTVQFGLDAESGQAMTAFELAHIRNAEENADDRTSIPSHPLYLGQEYWGAPLVDEYTFP